MEERKPEQLAQGLKYLFHWNLGGHQHRKGYCTVYLRRRMSFNGSA